MRTASPWWLSLVFGIGLLFILLGERVFGDGGLRAALTMVGVILVVGVTGVRAWTTMGTSGSRKKVERALLFYHLATVASLVVYTLTTEWGLSKLSMSEIASAHFKGAATVLFVVILIASVVPVLMIEFSLGTALREEFEISSNDGDDGGVELYRVRDVGWSGLSIALATAFLMVTCNVASERNIQRDVSYFKTSAPGTSTINIVKAQQEPLKVLLFFPAVNEVKEQVKQYFEALAAATGQKVIIEEHDRYSDATLAGKYKVTKDGVIVLVKGKDDAEKSQTLEIDTDIEKARKQGTGKLRNLDREINTLLMKVVRDKRKAYVMTGHGEINDPDSVPPDIKGKIPDRRTTVFKKRLGELNYEVKDLGLMDLTSDVPDDATVVIILAPTVPLQEAEWNSLARYLDRGGRVMIAMDPKAQMSMGPLEQKLGVRMAPGDITDDDPKHFLPTRGGPADRRWAITSQFSAHASTTQLSRSVDKGLVLIDAGALEEVTPTAPAPTKTITIRTMDTSWLDLNENFTFDAVAGEKRQRYNIAAAFEGPKLKDKDGKDKDGYRALVFSDVDLFADLIYSNGMMRQVIMISGPLLEDSVRWLGGEENFTGEAVSEDDKPIKHTKDQQAKWFALIIIGAPILVLTIGLLGTWARRRRSLGKKSEVMS
ncbi:MAG TPA: Gldg family protein [Kofleriaceae bacterium]|jgi:hypothetical protein